MIYRTSPEQIADYFLNESISQSQLKLIAKGVDVYLANKEKAESTEKYFDEPAEHYIYGSAVDCKITEGDEVFKLKYKVSTLTSKPSDTLISIMRYVFDKVIAEDIPANPDGTVTIDGTTVFPLTSYSSYIIQACERENYQPRWGADAKINAITKDTADYWNEMIDSVGKQILTLEQSVLINRIVESFQPMLGQYTQYPEYFDLFFQVPLFGHLRGKAINGLSSPGMNKCKGLVDMLIVDHANHKIIIVDFKTMGDTVTNFHSQMRRRRYDIQTSFYFYLLEYIIENSGLGVYLKDYYPVFDGRDISDYSVQLPQFWVQSTVYDNNPVCYETDYSMLQMGRNGREAGYSPLSLESGNLSTIFHDKLYGYSELISKFILFTRKSTRHPSPIMLTWDRTE